jgi:hypothetical protein
MSKQSRVIFFLCCRIIAAVFIARLLGIQPALAADRPLSTDLADQLADQGAAEKPSEVRTGKLGDEDKSEAAAPQPIPRPAPMVAKSQPGFAPTQSGDALGVAGVVTGGFGVAAAVAGFLLNLKANSMVNDMENSVDAYTSSKESRQKTYKKLAWIGYGVGAACMAAGVALIGVAVYRSGSSGKSDLALLPAVGPGQAGVVLGGGF